MTLTCRVRRSPTLKKVVLYKDNDEITTQLNSPHVTLSNVALEDKGMYYCRAAWDTQGRTVEVISVKTFVPVLGEFIILFTHVEAY